MSSPPTLLYVFTCQLQERVTNHVGVVGLVVGRDAVRRVAVTRAAPSHDHVIHGVVILLLYLRPVVQ